MDCATIRQLLAFTQREIENVDADERAALREHLAACPDCAAHAAAEQRADAALAAAMQAVPLPIDLKPRLLATLARKRRPVSVGWVSAAAAGLLLALGMGTYAYVQHRPTIEPGELVTRLEPSNNADNVVDWYRDHGITMAFPPGLSASYLQSYDIVEFRSRRVPKLVFYSDKYGAFAQVLILSTRQFHLSDRDFVNGQDIPGATHIHVRRDGDFVFLISHNDRLKDLAPQRLQVN